MKSPDYTINRRQGGFPRRREDGLLALLLVVAVIVAYWPALHGGMLFDEHANWDDPRRGREFLGTGIQYIFADGGLKQSLEQEPEEWRVIFGEADKVFANGSVVIYRHQKK